MARRLAAALCLAFPAAALRGAAPPLTALPPAALPPEVVARVVAALPPLLAHAHGTPVARIWPGRGEARLSDGGSDIYEALFLPGGERLLTVARDGTNVVWSARLRRPLARARFPCNGSACMECSRVFPDGERVITLSSSGRAAFIWNASSGEHLRRIDLNSTARDRTWVARVLQPGGRVLTWAVVGPRYHTRDRLVVWDASSGRPMHSLRHRGRIRCLQASPCGKKVLVASGSTLSLWSGVAGTLNLEIPVPFFQAWDDTIRVSRGGARIFAAVRSDIYVWDGLTGDVLRRMSMEHNILNFAIDAEGRRIFAFSQSLDNVSDAVWDIGLTDPLRLLPGRSARRVLDIAVSADGDAVATCAAADAAHSRRATQVQVWDAASGRVLLLRTYEDDDPIAFPGWRPCSVALSSVSHALLGDFAM